MKEKIIKKLIEQISDEVQVLELAAKSAHSAATHEESRAEDQHDTRSIEASYLAAGTAKRLEELQRTVSVLKIFRLRNFGEDEAIAPGALVELESGDSPVWYFLLPVAGGYKLNVDGKSVNVITPQSALGEELLDKHAGDEVEVRAAKNVRSYEISSVS